jgi:diaminohydroxyphosphoribosylaminopyrimidine deaminase/5-amino-6-(5-phosphoribosylamino)uracil reductase
VVIACPDPNPRVEGGGVAALRAAGIEVQSGLMQAAAEDLNCGFLQRAHSGRPWVRVKSAVSLDGRTALANGESRWISGEESRRDVQRWRARASAILTGIGTVLADDPSLDARVDAPVRQPLRVVADSGWRSPPGSRVLREPSLALVAGRAEAAVPRALQAAGVDCLPLPGSADGGVDLAALLQALGEREINEVQVEAGSRLCGSLLRAGLVDEILLYQAPLLLGDEAAGPFALGPLESMAGRTHLDRVEAVFIGADLRLLLRPRRGD